MGVVVGDYDNDGFPDILITAYGKLFCITTIGDGTFTDVTAKAGVAVPGWTTSGVWFDYDGDGRLDLFLCSFVEYARTASPAAITNSAVITTAFRGSSSRLPTSSFTTMGTERSRRSARARRSPGL